MARIGVEQSLSAVTDALKSKGFDVTPLEKQEDAQECDCCVISGQDVNVMGIQDAVTEGSVIDARGMNADQVCEAVEERLQ